MLRCSKKVSNNSKTGPVWTTYREVGQSCPQDCALMHNGCYAELGHVALFQRDASSEQDGEVYYDWLMKLPVHSLVRLHVSGDFFYKGAVDDAYIDRILDAHLDRPDVVGWSYTHGWRVIPAKRLNSLANLVISASVETLAEETIARSLGWKIARVDTTARLRTDMLCPAQTTSLQCNNCKLCWTRTNSTIVFHPHGARKIAVEKMISLKETTYE